MIHRFATIITQEGRWYVACAVELGVTGQGRTIPEALKNLKGSLDLYLENNPRSKKLISRNTPLLTMLELGYA